MTFAWLRPAGGGGRRMEAGGRGGDRREDGCHEVAVPLFQLETQSE